MIECAGAGRIGFDEFAAVLDEARLDPRDEDALAALAPLLRRLAANRSFLAERVIAELETRCARQERGNAYGAQVVMLHRAPGCFVRANFWPSARDSVVRASGTAPFFYGLAHDHNFSFLTVGYWGPGYWSDYYEYDGGAVAGFPREKVDLRFVERSRLAEGRMLLYRAHRDVHVQHPADRFSVSLNIVASSPATAWRDQYRFAVARGEIAGQLALAPGEVLMPLALQLGGEEGAALVEEYARCHPSGRVRFAAIAAKAAAATNPEARSEILARGAADADPRLAGLCRHRVAEWTNGGRLAS